MQTLITTELENLPINHALLQLVSNSSSSSSTSSGSSSTTSATPATGGNISNTTITTGNAVNNGNGNGNLNRDCDIASIQNLSPEDLECYNIAKSCIEELALYLKPYTNGNVGCLLSRPMLRKLVTLINCQLVEDEGRARSLRAARSLGERTVTELILQHQNPQQLSTNLWAAVRARGCQFLGPAMQEEVLKLVLLALEDGSALSRKVLVMFVVQRLQPHFLQASKTSIGHVVQLLYRASCFKVSKREGDSSLMQLKEEFRTYEALRREHDGQIVQIATEAGLRIAPDQWSALLYGDSHHKSHMQSIIDKLQTPQSFAQSVQELVIALQRTGDPANLAGLRIHLKHLADIDASTENTGPTSWQECSNALIDVKKVVIGLVDYVQHHGNRKLQESGHNTATVHNNNSGKYKISLCRDLNVRGTCPRGTNCTFAHSEEELERHRIKLKKNNSNGNNRLSSGSSKDAYDLMQDNLGPPNPSYLLAPPPPHSSSSVEENSPIRFPNTVHNNNHNTKVQSRYSSTKSPIIHQHNSTTTSPHGLPTHQIPYPQNANVLHPPPLVPPSPVNTRFPFSPNHHSYNSYHQNTVPPMPPPSNTRNYRPTGPPPPPPSHQLHSKNMSPISYPPYAAQQQPPQPLPLDGAVFNPLASHTNLLQPPPPPPSSVVSAQSPNSNLQQQFSPSMLAEYGGTDKIDRKFDMAMRGGLPPPTPPFNMNWGDSHQPLGISKYNQQQQHHQQQLQSHHLQTTNTSNYGINRLPSTNKHYGQLLQRKLEILKELERMPASSATQNHSNNNNKLPLSMTNDNNLNSGNLCFDNMHLWNYGKTPPTPTTPSTPTITPGNVTGGATNKDTFVRSDSILTDDDTFFDTSTSPSNKFGPISRMNKNLPTNQQSQTQQHSHQYQHGYHNLVHSGDTNRLSHLSQSQQQMEWNTGGYNSVTPNNKMFSKHQQQPQSQSQQHQTPPNNKNSPTAILNNNNHLNIKNNNIGGESATAALNNNNNDENFFGSKNNLEIELSVLDKQIADLNSKFASQHHQPPPQPHQQQQQHHLHQQQLSHPSSSQHHPQHHHSQQQQHHNNHLNHSQHNQQATHHHPHHQQQQQQQHLQLGVPSNYDGISSGGDMKHKHKMKDPKEIRVSLFAYICQIYI